MGDEFLGKFKYVSGDNVEAYLKACGAGDVMIKMATTFKPDVKMEKSGDEWTITMVLPAKNKVVKFTLGKEFEDTMPDGRTILVTTTLEGGKLVSKQKPKGEGKPSTITRSIKDGTVTVEMECEGVKATQVFKKE